MKDEKIKTHFILGTAGHGYHGKTALIKAPIAATAYHFLHPKRSALA